MGIKVSNEMASLRPFTLVLDETSIDGRVDLGLQPLNIDLELLVDQLNIDQYMVGSKIVKATSTTNLSIPFPLAPIKLTLVQSMFREIDD